MEISIISSYIAMPREGHLEQVFHIFAYLRKWYNTELVFDPTDPIIDKASYEERDWTLLEFGHIQAEEILSGSMPCGCRPCI